MGKAVIALVLTGVNLGTALAQPLDQPSSPSAQVLQNPNGGVIVINTAPPLPEQDKCGPLNTRLNSEKCDALLSPARTIRMRPGVTRYLRFDRTFSRIEIDSSPLGAIDIVPSGSNTIAILEAKQAGKAEIYIFGVEDGSGTGPREVLFAGSVIASEAEPEDVLSRIHVHSGPNIHQSRSYDCGDGSGCSPRAPGGR